MPTPKNQRKVNIKFLGDCKHDFGVFPDELADASAQIPEKDWLAFIEARHNYEMWYEHINSFKQYKKKV